MRAVSFLQGSGGRRRSSSLEARAQVARAQVAFLSVVGLKAESGLNPQQQ